MNRKKQNSLFYHKYFEIFILLLTVVSVGFLFIEKIYRLTPDRLDLLNKIDFIILIIFAVEFICKLKLFKKDYFFGEFGWIDLLSTLPIFNPAIKALRSISLLKSFRLLKIMRLLRLLRLLRFLKITKQTTSSAIKQKIFMPVSSVIIIMFLVISLLAIEEVKFLSIQNFKADKIKFINLLKETRNIEPLKKITSLLQIKKNNRLIFKKVTPEQLQNQYLKSEQFFWKIEYQISAIFKIANFIGFGIFFLAIYFIFHYIFIDKD